MLAGADVLDLRDEVQRSIFAVADQADPDRGLDHIACGMDVSLFSLVTLDLAAQ